MRVLLPIAMSISMAERALQELGSPNGRTLQKSDGLPSPERSGSPELNTRSSQWNRDRLAYASKEDAHQIDDWPEARGNRKSEDVLVRYKDTRGSKGLSTRMDPHAWSDFPTDTDDEVADNATSPVWNGAHDAGFSPKSTISKTEVDISIQQPVTTVPRNRGCVRRQPESVDVQFFAKGDNWETVALDGVASRHEAEIPDAEKERRDPSTKLQTPVASAHNGPRGPRNVPGRSTHKPLDDQASMKMSHRYYTSSGSDPSRRKSIPTRVPAGKEDQAKHRCCDRNQNDHSSKFRKSAPHDALSVKEFADSSTSDDDSDGSDAREVMVYEKRSLCERDMADESFREMILQKYLVMVPANANRTKSTQWRASADIARSQEGQRCSKTRAKTGESAPYCGRKLSGKSLHAVSTSRTQRYQLRKSLKSANPYSSSEAPHSRQSVSQPPPAPAPAPSPSPAATATEVQRSNASSAAEGTPQAEPQPANPSSLEGASMQKSWSTGDLHHSKSLGDMGILTGHALSHRAFDCQPKVRSPENHVAISGDPKVVSGSDAPQTKMAAQLTSGHSLNNLEETSSMAAAVEGSSSAAEVSGKGDFHNVPCDCLNSASLSQQGVSKTDGVPPQGSGAIPGPVECQWQGQGLSSLALLPGPVEPSDKTLKSSDDHDPSPLPCMGMNEGGPIAEYPPWNRENPVPDSHFNGHWGNEHSNGHYGYACVTRAGGPSPADDAQWSRESPIAKEHTKLHNKAAEESSDGGSSQPAAAKLHQAHAGGKRAEESRNIGFNKPKSFSKKVTAVVPFDSCGDDQVLPDVSLAGQLASLTILELQHQVLESSEHHIADDKRHQHVRVQRTSPELRCWGTEKLPQQQTKGFWDTTQELQKEKQNLLKRLQELDAHHPCNRLKAMSGTKVQITEEDAKKLRQEILEQEALIRGYQVENEKAVAKLREVQLEAKQKMQEMAEEKAHLASQLVNRQMLNYATDSTSLHEKLQGALSRETALRLELEKMRDSHMELEKRLKREESSRVKDLEMKLASLQEAVEAERQSTAQMEGRKQAMIQQEELIASLQESISDQASKIRSLTNRLETGEGQDVKEAQLQIETLQNQVKQLEASLRASKKETGLHALQVAKSGMEENETCRRLQAELMAVQRNALQKEEETNRIIHHLKVENEKIKHESSSRFRALNHQIQTQAKNGHSMSESELSALNRVKDLEKQIANLRIQYSRKVKELSDKLEETKHVEATGQSKTSTNNMFPPSRVAAPRLQPAQGKALREAKERIALQEDVISQKDRTIKSLQKRIQTLVETNGGPETCNASVHVVPTVEPEKRAREGHSSYCSGSKLTAAQKQGSKDSPQKVTGAGAGAGAVAVAVADEVAVLRRELEKSELTREVLQKTCNESVEKTVLLTLQHQQALQMQHIRSGGQSQPNHHCASECPPNLPGWGDHRNGLEGMTWLTERSSPVEMANRSLEARLKIMSEDLQEANTMCQQSPRMTQIMHLKKKVAEMEARQQQKEVEWQKMLQETKQTSNMEQEFAECMWREALDAKSMEVEKIRLELNTILEAAMAMQHAQLHMNKTTLDN